MNKPPIPTAFGDLVVAPARRGLRDALVNEVLLNKLSARQRHLAGWALGLDGQVPLPPDEVHKVMNPDPFRAPRSEIKEARDKAEVALAQDAHARQFRAGLAGKACLASLRTEMAASVAGRHYMSDEFRQFLEAATIAEYERTQERAKATATRQSKLLFGIGVAWLLFLTIAILLSSQFAAALVLLPAIAIVWTRAIFLVLVKLRRVALPAPPLLWNQDQRPPDWPLVDVAEISDPDHSPARALRDRIRLITTSAYEGEAPIDAHQALLEIGQAMGLLGGVFEPELTLPASFADALCKCPCGGLADLHSSSFSGCTPIGDALGFSINRDAGADALTLHWRKAAGEDPFVVIAPLPAVAVAVRQGQP